MVGKNSLRFIRNMLDAGINLFLPSAEAEYADSC
jgi:hypothetical protein